MVRLLPQGGYTEAFGRWRRCFHCKARCSRRAVAEGRLRPRPWVVAVAEGRLRPRPWVVAAAEGRLRPRPWVVVETGAAETGAAETGAETTLR